MNQYAYDAWGRPFSPPPQPSVTRREYDELLNMVSRLGERFNTEIPPGYPVTSANLNQQPQPSAQLQLTSVTSEEEAWNCPNDLINGKKQFFIDLSTMTVYAKWVDSNIDLQKAVGKLHMITGTGTVNEPVVADAVTLKTVDEKLTELSEEMIEIKALIEAANTYQNTKIKAKKQPLEGVVE